MMLFIMFLAFPRPTLQAVGRGRGGKYSVGEDNNVKRGGEGGEDRYNGKERSEGEDDKKEIVDNDEDEKKKEKKQRK